MIAALSPRMRQFLALALLGLALLGGLRLVVLPLWDQVAAERAALRREKQLLAHAVRLAAQLATRPAAAAPAARLLPGHRAAVAAASLQERLTGLIHRSGGSLQSAQVLPAPARAGLRPVRLRVTIRIDNDGLIALVHALETAPWTLFIDGIRIHAPRFVALADHAAAAPGPLMVVMDVTGYIRAATGSRPT
ncbi:MAG: type II secretion system protein GspM [Acetobacteraceae bacterium]